MSLTVYTRIFTFVRNQGLIWGNDILEQLTKKQKLVYEFIRDKIQNRGYGPTVREIGERFAIRSPNGVMCHLKAIEKKGLIHRSPNKSRAIELTGEAKRQRGLPLVGRVAAGVMHEAIEQSDRRIELGEMFKGKNVFVLEVSGDSMIDANIQDGDFVVIEPRETAKTGEMVVARTEDGEPTLDPSHRPPYGHREEKDRDANPDDGERHT